jgi:hypothetical protein
MALIDRNCKNIVRRSNMGISPLARGMGEEIALAPIAAHA